METSDRAVHERGELAKYFTCLHRREQSLGVQGQDEDEEVGGPPNDSNYK